jgi:hypothetical protein
MVDGMSTFLSLLSRGSSLAGFSVPLGREVRLLFPLGMFEDTSAKG